MLRVTLELTPNLRPIRYEHYLSSLTGALHRLLGENNPEHDAAYSLFGHSFLYTETPPPKVKPHEGDLSFPTGALWNLGFFDDALYDRIEQALWDDAEVAFGMYMSRMHRYKPPSLGRLARFKVNGMVVARKSRDDGGTSFLLWDDPEADDVLTYTFREKLRRAGFDGPEDLASEIRFDRAYERARTRLFRIHKTEIKGSECPVIVRGSERAVQFAWTCGVGALTGSGMGALY